LGGLELGLCFSPTTSLHSALESFNALLAASNEV
jgi:hypothetical protein